MRLKGIPEEGLKALKIKGCMSLQSDVAIPAKESEVKCLIRLIPHYQGRYCDRIVEEHLSYSDVE